MTQLAVLYSQPLGIASWRASRQRTAQAQLGLQGDLYCDDTGCKEVICKSQLAAAYGKGEGICQERQIPAKVELLHQLVHFLLGGVQVPLALHHLILGLGHRSTTSFLCVVFYHPDNPRFAFRQCSWIHTHRKHYA